MSGNCATGMRSIASAPAIVMTIAMTIASRGRAMKTAEIIGWLVPLSCLARSAGFGVIGGLAGPGETTMPGRARCTPSTMTMAPSVKPLRTDAVVGVDWPSWMRACCTLFCASTV